MRLRTIGVLAGLTLSLSMPAIAQDAAKVERGKAVYAEQKCALCRQWLTSPKEMAEKANATRKPAMKSFATLPKADLDALIVYLQTLRENG